MSLLDLKGKHQFIYNMQGSSKKKKKKHFLSSKQDHKLVTS